MSREQRRADRRQETKGGAPPPSRRTPVKAAGGSSRFPALLLAIVGSIVIVGGLVAYLILQSNGGGTTVDAAAKAAQDRSADIPGTYVEDQGKDHFAGGVDGHQMTPFCDGVPQSESARLTIIGGNGTPSASTTASPAATATPSPGASPTAHGTIDTTPTVPTNCYNSNPPTSGRHLGVLRNADVGGGIVMNVPADPDVYPDDVETPRDAIAHIQEHAGVFVGWNCRADDTACADAVQQLKDLVNDRIDNYDNRVVMAHDNDLPEGMIGVASWTRVLDVQASDWDNQKALIKKFISVNSCRFDPENICK